ncbi:MAG: hypothetical protein ACON4Z_10650 [Planctomycetota bacterium]
MSAAAPNAPSRRRFPVFALVLLASALISYTVVRLQGVAGRLPYDPGPPQPTVEVVAGDAAQTLDRLRATFLDGRSARVLGDDGALYESWPLAGIEYERALRVLGSMRERAPGPLCDALRGLVEQRRAFVLEREVFPPRADGDWRDWTCELFAAGGRRRLLVVPVDLRAFPGAREPRTGR